MPQFYWCVKTNTAVLKDRIESDINPPIEIAKRTAARNRKQKAEEINAENKNNAEQSDETKKNDN